MNLWSLNVVGKGRVTALETRSIWRCPCGRVGEKAPSLGWLVQTVQRRLTTGEDYKILCYWIRPRSGKWVHIRCEK